MESCCKEPPYPVYWNEDIKQPMLMNGMINVNYKGHNKSTHRTARTTIQCFMVGCKHDRIYTSNLYVICIITLKVALGQYY